METNSSLRTWSDVQLANAVGTSTSWLGVMRTLGLNATSASQVRVVRRHAERLKLDSSHFRGKRRWSDAHWEAALGATCPGVRPEGSAQVPACRGQHVGCHLVRTSGLRCLASDRADTGRVGILLRTYRKYIVGNAQGLLGTGEDAGEAEMRASA